MGNEVIYLFVVYGADTQDYPGQYPVRRHIVSKSQIYPDALLGLASSLEEARKLIPNSAEKTCFPRCDEDDPAIIESWI